MPTRENAVSEPVPGRRKVLAALAGGVTIGVAGCQTLDYYPSFVGPARETTIEAAGDGWRIDGAVSAQFGDEPPDELRAVTVVAVDDDGESMASSEVGTIPNPDSDDRYATASEPFDLSVSQFPYRITIDMASPCDSAGTDFELRYYERASLDSAREGSLDDEDVWEQDEYTCERVDNLGDSPAVRINSSLENG